MLSSDFMEYIVSCAGGVFIDQRKYQISQNCPFENGGNLIVFHVCLSVFRPITQCIPAGSHGLCVSLGIAANVGPICCPTLQTVPIYRHLLWLTKPRKCRLHVGILFFYRGFYSGVQVFYSKVWKFITNQRLLVTFNISIAYIISAAMRC